MAGAIISSDAGGASGMRNMRSQILNSVCSVPRLETKKSSLCKAQTVPLSFRVNRVTLRAPLTSGLVSTDMRRLHRLVRLVPKSGSSRNSKEKAA